MKTPIKFILSFALLLLAAADIAAQELITNVYGRDVQSLNGKWDAIVDLYDQGRKNKIYLNRRPEGKTDFYEYSFDNGLRLDVPSDWNCQMPELKYYEGTVWYARRFDAPEQTRSEDRPAAVPLFRSRQLPLPGLPQRRGDRRP